MLEFCPWRKSCLEEELELRTWMEYWLPEDTLFLTPKDWFIRGHDVVGGTVDPKVMWKPVT